MGHAPAPRKGHPPPVPPVPPDGGYSPRSQPAAGQVASQQPSLLSAAAYGCPFPFQQRTPLPRRCSEGERGVRSRGGPCRDLLGGPSRERGVLRQRLSHTDPANLLAKALPALLLKASKNNPPKHL